MSRLFVLVNIAVVLAFSTDMNRKVGRIVGPIALRTSGKSLPFLHLFKHKVQYQKLDKIVTTTATTPTATPTVTPTVTTTPHRHCICVPFYLCDSNQTIITDGAGIIDFRFRRCTGDFEVCCYPRNVTTTPRPTTTSDPPWTFPTAIPTRSTTATTTTGFPNCICVDISLCDPSGIVGFFGEGTIVPRGHHGLCPIPGQVCCRILATTTTTTTTMSPTTTRLPPGHTQLCFVCGNFIQCFTCAIIVAPDGNGVIDPRFSSQFLSGGNVCSATNALSCTGRSVMPIADLLGQLKNPNTAQDCYCVKTWLCAAGNAISPDGLGIIDPRFTTCSSVDQVCCRVGGIDLQGLRGASSSVDFLTGRSDEPSSREIACGVRNDNYAPPQPFPADSGKTYFAEFPWMVAIFAKPTDGGPYVFHCGASMISNGAVLTAAHCVTNRKPESLMAHFGQWDIGSDAQPLPIREASILAIAVHPSYYNGGLFHDVAVLVLNEPVAHSANIMPICLPEQGTVFPAGIRCHGIGWGSSSSEGEHRAELRKVELPIVDRTDCQTRLRNTKLGQHFQLHGSFICAGGEVNRDTCRGDGGGPLICQATTDQFFQAGVVSWGMGCGDDVPAVYASVSQHRQWIDQQLATYGV